MRFYYKNEKRKGKTPDRTQKERKKQRATKSNKPRHVPAVVWPFSAFMDEGGGKKKGFGKRRGSVYTDCKCVYI